MNGIYRIRLARLARLSPWVWIAAIFGAQAVGSLAITALFKMAIREVLVPILILLLGMAVSALLARRDLSGTVSWWARSIPFPLYALFIFSLSSRDYPDAQMSMNADLFHLAEFSTLGFFLAFFWYPLLKRSGSFLFSAAVLGSGLLFALSDELHQFYVPGRTASVIDLVYDATALAAACFVFLVGVNVRTNLQRMSVDQGS